MKKLVIVQLFLCLVSIGVNAQTKNPLSEDEKKYLLKFVYPVSSVQPDFQNNEDLKVLDNLVGNSPMLARASRSCPNKDK